MYIAIAMENLKNSPTPSDYRIWYLELNGQGEVCHVGVKSKNELVESLFHSYRTSGKTNWRALLKEQEQSTPIEIYDFLAMNNGHNTHFGNLPTLGEFQKTLERLEINLEIRAIA